MRKLIWAGQNELGRFAQLSFAIGLVALFATFTTAQETKVETKKEDQPKNVSVVQLPAEGERSSAAKFTVTLSPNDAKLGEEVTLTIKATVAEGWHIYPTKSPDEKEAIGYPTEIEFTSKVLKPIDEAFKPSVEATTATVDGEQQSYFKGTFEWSRKYKVSRKRKSYSGKGSISFQACTDEQCLPPNTLAFSFKPPAEPKVFLNDKVKHKFVGDPIVVSLEKCKETRPRVKISLFSLLTGGGTDKLVLKGNLKVDEEKFDVFLPAERKYTFQNKAKGGTRFENTASYLSIDYDADGTISNTESSGLNRLVRFGDSMFTVREIDTDASTLTIQQVDEPLSGTIVGQKLPPFEYQTTDGKKITNESLLGKVTILDIWAVT